MCKQSDAEQAVILVREARQLIESIGRISASPKQVVKLLKAVTKLYHAENKLVTGE